MAYKNLYLQQAGFMARVCDRCQKGPVSGQARSFSMRATKRRFVPNLQQLRTKVDGVTTTLRVCTQCLRTLSRDVA